MAYDKVIDSSALDAGMTATANAIRAKTGGSSPIAWDHENGFKAAVEGISGGGGGVALPELTNPGTDTDLAEGTQLIGADGSIVTGKLGVISSMQITTGNTSVQYNDTSIYVTGKRNSRAIIESGSTIRMDVSSDKFGDARQSQVLEGTTFTSSNGLCLPGTMKATGGVTLPELGDTAAKPSDIAYGKVLYDDNGNPVAGNLKEFAKNSVLMQSSDVELSVGQLFVAQVNYQPANSVEGVILRKGSIIALRTPAEKLGNAEAKHVAKGFTFTSKAGVLIPGEMEVSSSGSTTAGVATFTLGSDVSTAGTFVKLGNVPWIAEHINDENLYVDLIRLNTTTTNNNSIFNVVSCNTRYVNGYYGIGLYKQTYMNSSNNFDVSFNDTTDTNCIRLCGDNNGDVYIAAYNSYFFAAGNYALLYGLI